MSPKPITEDTLFYGDNLPILREYIPTVRKPTEPSMFGRVLGSCWFLLRRDNDARLNPLSVLRNDSNCKAN